MINKGNVLYKQIATESRHERHYQRSSPIAGIQSSHEVKQERFGSPVLTNRIDDYFQSNVNSSRRVKMLSSTSSSSSSSSSPSSYNDSDSSILPRDFNSHVFYRNIFQPEILTDNHHQRYIEMKLGMHVYNPDKIKVSINNNDLVVQVEETNFSERIALPTNIDASSLSFHHDDDGKLYITIKLLNENSSIIYV